MARRPRNDDERSMDSLMDAMTNVVGILLLILIVSSLGITDQVKKIMANMPEINPDQLEAMKASRKKTLDTFQDLMSTYNKATEAKVPEDEAQQLALALEKFEKENEDLASKTSDLEALLAESKKLEPLKDDREKRNTAAAKKLNDLEASLAAKPTRAEAAAREITLPDPRPADPQAFVFYVACKNQKLYPVGEPYEMMLRLRDLLDQNFKELAYTGAEIGSHVYDLKSTKKDDNGRYITHLIDFQARTRRDKEALGFMNQVSIKSLQAPDGTTIFRFLFGASEAAQESKRQWPLRKLKLDKDKVAAFFKKSEGKGDFTYVPVFESDRIKITLRPNPDGGLTENQMFSNDSPFVELVKKAAVNRRVIIMYYVSSDSFDTYLRARDFSTSQNVPAGWDLWDGETLPNLAPNKQRDSAPYNLNALDKAAYLTFAQSIGPKLAEKVNAKISTFEADLAAVKVPDELKGPEIDEFNTGLRANRVSWANAIIDHVRGLYIAPLVVSEATRNEEVAIELHPPYVMHTRIFTPNPPPNAPVPKPRTPAAPGKGTPPLILD